jgi:hypothetical protein
MKDPSLGILVSVIDMLMTRALKNEFLPVVVVVVVP